MIILEAHKKQAIHTAVFDFDGTISTLRCGWESVMEPMMTEYISGGKPTPEIVSMVKEYIDKSTGIQTIAQMKWLAETVQRFGLNPDAPKDAWEYKAEYNRRLMQSVEKRREIAKTDREKFLVAGAEEFLCRLKSKGIKIYAASGTDEADVRIEANTLGIDGYFDEIAGAKPFSEGCSKEATLKRLISECNNTDEGGIIVVGDGPVEIRLGRSVNALTLGVASDEVNMKGFNPAKLKRLENAGAHAIVDCFENVNEIFDWMEADL